MNIGNNITQPNDPLRHVTLRELYMMVSSPDQNLHSLCKRLMSIKELDIKEYRKAKTTLPYFVCASFTPSVRKIVNFASIDCFAVDFDHLSENGMDTDIVKKKLTGDPRVALCFVSPSKDGVKALINLSEKCFDAGAFSIFYKKFTVIFAHSHGLEQVLDAKTCDVTRACFLSEDADAYVRYDSEPVYMEEYVDIFDPFAVYEAKDIMTSSAASCETSHYCSEPSNEDIERIKQVLSIKRKAERPEKYVYVPAILESTISSIAEMLNDNGIILDTVVDIQYGKKLQMSCGAMKAEVNIFYGKKGFTTVPSPKRGTDQELNSLVSELLEYHLSDYYPDDKKA